MKFRPQLHWIYENDITHEQLSKVILYCITESSFVASSFGV